MDTTIEYFDKQFRNPPETLSELLLLNAEWEKYSTKNKSTAQKYAKNNWPLLESFEMLLMAVIFVEKDEDR